MTDTGCVSMGTTLSCSLPMVTAESPPPPPPPPLTAGAAAAEGSHDPAEVSHDPADGPPLSPGGDLRRLSFSCSWYLAMLEEEEEEEEEEGRRSLRPSGGGGGRGGGGEGEGEGEGEGRGRGVNNWQLDHTTHWYHDPKSELHQLFPITGVSLAQNNK